jgi:hypothetical protein
LLQKTKAAVVFTGGFLIGFSIEIKKNSQNASLSLLFS